MESNMTGVGRKRGRKPTSRLTEHQLRTLRIIRDYIEENGIPPTITELSEALGLTRSTIQDQIDQLVRKGYLNRETGKARSISLRESKEPLGTFHAIPIVGEVAAGTPVLAQENIVGEILIDGQSFLGGKCFALKVKGMSMAGIGIIPGDLIIVRQQTSAENGDIVVAMVDGDATVKRLHISEGSIELRPENEDYSPIVLGPNEDMRIVGKVVGIRHRAQE